jgi:microcompartment protein CcmL/EutN
MNALGLIEIAGWSPSMVVLDAMEKAAGVELFQVELNDLAGAMMKITGPLGAVRAAIDAGRRLAEEMRVACVTDIIANPEPRGRRGWTGGREYNPLIEQDVVHTPDERYREATVKGQAPFAVGLIETQGFTAVFEAIDTACKTADVEVLAREKLGGGYITVVIKGDVAAVRAAVEAGKAKVEGLGRLIAAHVIPSPTEAVLSLLPKQG